MKRRITHAFTVLCFLSLILDFTIDYNKPEPTGSIISGISSYASVDMEAIARIYVAEADVVTTTSGYGEEPICGYMNVGICNVDSGNLNVRETPGEDGKIIGKLPKNGACEVLSEENNWFYMTSGEVSGYVSGDYLLTGEEAYIKAKELATLTATALTGGLNVREQPNTDCKVVDQMPEGEELEVLEQLDGWVKVDFDGEEAYVSADYVTVEYKLIHAMTMSEVRFGAGVSDVRASIVSTALQYVGNKYVWGGTSLTKGVDCSGFTMQIYGKYGFKLPHYSGSQAGYGKKVSLADAKPGDLVFYSNGKSINHVAIYMGNGQIVHAANARSGIKISKVNYRTPTTIRNIIGD